MPDPHKDDLYEVPPYSDRDGSIAFVIAACIIAAVLLLTLRVCGVVI